MHLGPAGQGRLKTGQKTSGEPAKNRS